ncbi:MAG TPA: septum formation initiator family protein [Acidimicrobiales bacterium]|nr:septum formation initiator family protein [Acidimicrobiales bacterium]
MSDVAFPIGYVAVPDFDREGRAERARPRLRIAVRPTRRRVAGIAFITATITLAALFAAAVFQTVLVQGQQRLDQLDRQVGDEQNQFDQLRAEVAQLESPDRIVAVAQNRLGMVQPTKVTYIAPTVEQVVSVVSATGQALPDDKESDAATTGAGRPWSQLKPLVGSAP